MKRTSETFGAAAASWNMAKLGRFVLAAVDYLLLVTDETLDPDQSRKQAAELAKKLLPLRMRSRMAPLTVFVDALGDVEMENPDALAGALQWLFDLPGSELTAPRFYQLLDLLVEADVRSAGGVISLAQERLLGDPQYGDIREESAALLVRLAGHSKGRAQAYMVSQLSRAGVKSFAITDAAMHTAVPPINSDPEALAEVFRLLQRELAESDIADLAGALEDLTDRSSLLFVSAALTNLNPSRFETLFRAAFGTRTTPGVFRLERGKSLNGNSRLIAAFEDQEIDFFDFNLRTQTWEEELYDTLDLMPPPPPPARFALFRSSAERRAGEQGPANDEDTDEEPPMWTAAIVQKMNGAGSPGVLYGT